MQLQHHSTRNLALQAYDCALVSHNPDWQSVAADLRRALVSVPAAAPKVATRARKRTAKAVVQPRGHAMTDYPVDKTNWKRLQWPSPILEVTFADGEVVRAPAVSIVGKAVNVARGLRVACAFYKSRHPDRYVPRFTSIKCDMLLEPIDADAASEAMPIEVLRPDAERDYGYRSLYDPRDYYRRLRRNLPLNCPATSAWIIAKSNIGK